MSRKKKKKARTPEFVETLSRPPDDSWIGKAFYHGTRIGLLVFLAAAIMLLFPSHPGPGVDLYALGDVAREDVAAEVGFDVPQDAADLQRLQDDAAATIPPVFKYDPGTQGRVEEELNQFFDRLRDAVEAGGRPALEAVLEDAGLSLPLSESGTLLNPIELQALRTATLSVVREFMNRFLDSEQEDAVMSAGRITYFEGGEERTSGVSDLLWGPDFFAAAVASLEPSTLEFRNIVSLLLIHFSESPFTVDASRTSANEARARRAVPTIVGSVVEGEFIVRRGDQIGSTELRRLNAHTAALQALGLIQEVGRDWAQILGSFLLNLLLLSVFGVLLFFYRPEVYRSFRWILLLSGLVLTYFLAAAGISWLGYPWELLPIAFVVLPVAILWDGRMALILALVLGILSGAQAPFSSFSPLVFTIAGGAAAALSARAVRRRSQTWIFIALITLGYSLTLAALTLTGNLPAEGILLSILVAGGNATVSAILAMGFMPVFEWFTGITTDQTLLEWADPNRPLLKSLSLEASGTYAHTISVANLVEAAANSIGANGLLARVGIYYHDVGKMLKPQYFVENQPGGRNPHDKLKPHTSASLVKEHVIEGERMARDEGVPDVVARFIPEHHGTQLIGFFYEKAKEESDEEPDEREFRYPGPKPQSKETAIAMLADSVESATRALQDPSPEKIKELVKTVVDGKIRDGQLSEAPLTLREIDKIQEQFVKVVAGMFHHRLDYPATRHITESPSDETESETAEAPENDPTAPSDAGPGKDPESPPQEPLEEQLPLGPAEEGESPSGTDDG